MDLLSTAILDFILTTVERPLPPDIPTRLVMMALRVHLDATAPGWRTHAFDTTPADTTAVEVEFHLEGGRVVRGVLIQRPSAVRGKAA